MFDRIKEVLLNDRVLKDIVKKLNKTRKDRIKPLAREYASIERQIESYISKKNRVFELYEDGTISKDMLNERLLNIEETLNNLANRKAEIELEIDKNGSDKIPY